MVWGVLGVVWSVFLANMAGRCIKNAFKFVLQLLIPSQKQILCVKNVVWGGFGVFPQTILKLVKTVYCVSKS